MKHSIFGFMLVSALLVAAPVAQGTLIHFDFH
jgi:hypothetical protein